VPRRLLVDADALRALLEAATGRPDPAAVASAVAALLTSGTAPPARPWLSVDEAARQLGVSERTVRRHAATGQLRSRRLGRRLLIASEALTGPERTRADTVRDTRHEVPDARTETEGDAA
jgi:excisionase family DNA binding protein